VRVAGKIEVDEASISGRLIADRVEVEDLEAKNATISGEFIAKNGRFEKLYAKEIIGQISTPEALAKGKTPEFGNLNSGVEEFGDEAATTSSQLLAEVDHQSSIIGHYDYLDIASIDADSLIVDNLLAVIGQAITTDLEVTNALVVNDTMMITDNSISVVSPTSEVSEDFTSEVLYLQPSGVGGIDMMGGKFRINDKGDVFIDGDVYFAGDLNIKNKKLNIKNNTNEDVASIDASGSAKLADVKAEEARFEKLFIGGPRLAEALGEGGPLIATSSGSPAPGAGTSFDPGAEQSAEISTNATAGKSVLPAYEEELTIENQNITKDSLIYITPLSNPYNKVLYVKNKYVNQQSAISNQQSSYFTVAIDSPIAKDIEFNWWIIN
jgi:hypothetical protein